MPFVLEQPNLGKPDENHLYFDPGDGRLLMVFTNESREDADGTRRERSAASNTSRSTCRGRRSSGAGASGERGIEFIQRDRGFMDSIYLHDPNGLKVELACYKFETPEGFRAVDVLMKAQCCESSEAIITSPMSTSPMRSSCCWQLDHDCARPRNDD